MIFPRNCKTTAGYTLKQDDRMPGFFFAETLKYPYLLLAPEETLDLNKVVLNTEAHPFSIYKK